MWDSGLLADFDGGWVFDLPVPRNGGGAVRVSIVKHRMFRPFAQQDATVGLEVPNKISALHASETARGSWMTLCPV